MSRVARTFLSAMGGLANSCKVSLSVVDSRDILIVYGWVRGRDGRMRERRRKLVLTHDVACRVLAGVRWDDRMPSWMLADVLQDAGIPEWMCALVRNSDLERLGDGGNYWSVLEQEP